jgi:hypothetical protein
VTPELGLSVVAVPGLDVMPELGRWTMQSQADGSTTMKNMPRPVAAG